MQNAAAVCRGIQHTRANLMVLVSCYALLVTCTASVAALPTVTNNATPPKADTPTLNEVKQRLAGIGLRWVPNAGQWDEQVAFRAQSFAGSVWVTRDGGIVHQFVGKVRPGQEIAATGPGRSHPRHDAQSGRRDPDWVLTERFVTTHVAGQITGTQPQTAKASYFVGNDQNKHRSNLTSYGAINLGEVYPGVTVQLKATGNNVEKLFTVQPQHDPSVIRMRIDGAQSLSIADDGALEVQTGYGPVRYSRPVAFQTIDGQQRDVPVQYALNAPAGQYGFTLGDYVHSEPVTIDPLLQATFLGGALWDEVFAMAVHPVSGDLVVAGFTQSVNFPCTTPGGICLTGAQSAAAGGNGDAFVARLNPALTSLLQATYLGGSTGFEKINALGIDHGSGDVFVAGYTESTDFPCTVSGIGCPPTTINGAQSTYGGGAKDGFVSRLNSTLTTLLRSTFLGGSDEDQIYALVIHPATGEVVVAGETYSTNFPCTTAGIGCHPGATTGAQSTNGGGLSHIDGFVTRFKPGLDSILQSTYLGGGEADGILAMAVHPASGEIFVGGYAGSGLPCTTAGGLCSTGAQSIKGLGMDAFVARLDPTLTSLHQSTYLGGDGQEATTAMSIAATGEILVAGNTASTNFPCTTAAGLCATGAQSANAGGFRDGFVTRLNALLTNFLQSTYLGSTGNDVITAMSIQPISGDVLVAGITTSTGFPCTVAGGGCAAGAQSVFGGGAQDGFVARFDSSLTNLLQATYLGGTGGEHANAVTIHPTSGEVLVAGWTQSPDFPCTSVIKGCADGAQSLYAGGDDAFVVRMTADLALIHIVPRIFAFVPVINANIGTLQISLPVLIDGLDAPAPIAISGVLGAAYCISTNEGCSCDLSNGFTGKPGLIDNKRYVCAQHRAPAFRNGVNVSTVKIGAGAGQFHVATGSVLTACALDIDGNGKTDALTDGLILLRAMFGLTGTSVTNGAIGTGATRADWQAIRLYLNGGCGAGFSQ